MTACTRCPHPLDAHGAGCTVGWLETGPECHCPNDYDGEVSVDCCYMGCALTPTHADMTGQFYCPQHAVQPYRTRAFDKIKKWSS